MPESRRIDVLLTAEQIRLRVAEIATDIGRDCPAGVHVVAVLKGAFVFLSDLIRQMDGRVTVDFVALASYADGKVSSGDLRLLKDADEPIEGRDVVIVEDIVDSGLTLTGLHALLRTRAPRTLRTACLLSKPSRRQVNVKVDYIGFTIDDHFVVGYGLDYAGRYRNLPFIATLT